MLNFHQSVIMLSMDRQEFEIQYLSRLNPQQREAVCAVEGPVLVLATPGSGKTTVLVLRLGYMILCCGIDPRHILTTTYTRAATKDMGERFASFFGAELAGSLSFRTINGVSAGIISRVAGLYGREAFSLLGNEGERGRILRQVWTAVNGTYPEDSEVREFGTAVTYVKNMLLTDEELETADRGVARLPELFRAYQAELRRRRVMDFDDQMVYALTLPKRFPKLLADVQNRYRYFCVDEAQDTSRVQHEIIRLLASRDRNLFMVGDEDQSIYSFRAAYPAALLRFQEEYPEARLLPVEENYRSTPEIVAVANRFIGKNRNRHAKSMVSTRPSGPKLSFLSVSGRGEQYRWLLRNAGGMPPDTAVLFRNNDSLLPLADGLSAAGIPFTCRNYEDNFFTHREVQDVCDIIRFSAEPSDRDLFRRFYYRICPGITKAEAEDALRLARPGENLLEVLAGRVHLSPRKSAAVRQCLVHLSALRRDSATRVLSRIWDDMGYGRYARRGAADSGKFFILTLLAGGIPSAGLLLRHLEEVRTLVTCGSLSGGNGLALSTVRSSKGLEYDRVYLLDMLDGILPSVPERELETPRDREAYEEERRLFYVAMTRAKNELFLFLTPEAASFPREVLRDLPDSAPGGLLSRLHKAALPRKPRMTPDEFLAGHGAGDTVTHKSFGRGTLETVSGDIITVRFDEAGTKRLSLSAALKNRLVEGEPHNESD